jgi:Bacterial Ig domain
VPIEWSAFNHCVVSVAGTTSSIPLASLAIWLDGKKIFNTGQPLLNTAIAVAPGTHVLAAQGINGAKQVFTQTISITAVAPVCQSLAAVPSENICTPANGASVSSPITVQSTANTANPIKYSQLWLDGVFRYQVASASINTSVSAASGTHRLTVQTMDASGILAKQTIYVTVAGNPPPCTLSAADPSVTICAPANNAAVTSPVTITAAPRDSAASVVNMFIWVDGVKQWQGSGGTVNTPIALAKGTRRLTVQAKDASGRYFQSVVYVNVQ